MNVTKIYTPNENISQFNDSLIQLAINTLKTNLALKQTDSLLVVTDPDMEKQEGALWFEAGKQITPHSQMVVFEGMTQHAQEPPELVSLMMSKSNVLMLQTSYSLSHTKARQLANQKGARLASLPTVTMDIIQRTLNIDYQPIATRSNQIANLLNQATQVHITTPAGTDITFSIKDRSGIADTGFFTKPGEYGNLPAGEAFIAPLEGTAQGVYVVDGSFASLDIDQPITITIKDGSATDINGGKAAKKLTKMLHEVGDDARQIGELGIGTNPQANPTGKLIEAEKAYGTVHIALGNNSTFGGTINIPFHSDGVLLSPTVSLDGQRIIQDGKFKT